MITPGVNFTGHRETMGTKDIPSRTPRILWRKGLQCAWRHTWNMNPWSHLVQVVSAENYFSFRHQEIFLIKWFTYQGLLWFCLKFQNAMCLQYSYRAVITVISFSPQLFILSLGCRIHSPQQVTEVTEGMYQESMHWCFA